MKLETHVHSKGVSICSNMDYKEIVDNYANLGYGGIILTNHYSPMHIKTHENETYSEWLELFINEYKLTKEYGNKKDLKVFLGAELTIIKPYYCDLLMVGVTEEFLRTYPKLYQYDLASIYNLCQKENILLIQAHPFRIEQNHSLQSLYCLDGLEINTNPKYTISKSCKDIIMHIAHIYNKKITAGSDAHKIDAIGKGGMIVPDYISSSQDFAQFLRETPIDEIQIIE